MSIILQGFLLPKEFGVLQTLQNETFGIRRRIWGFFFILLWSALSEGIKTGIGFPCDNPRPLRKHKVSESLALFHSPFFYAHQYLDLSRGGMFGLF